MDPSSLANVPVFVRIENEEFGDGGRKKNFRTKGAEPGRPAFRLGEEKGLPTELRSTIYAFSLLYPISLKPKYPDKFNRNFFFCNTFII
jgi:hypothetical protein